VIDWLEHHPARRAVQLGVNWHLAPSVVYYRMTRELVWLGVHENADTHHSELPRSGFGGRMDYYYIVEDDLPSIAHEIAVVRSLEAMNLGTVDIGTPTFYRAP